MVRPDELKELVTETSEVFGQDSGAVLTGNAAGVLAWRSTGG